MVSTMKAVVCLFLCLSVCSVRGNYIPLEMNETIRDLLGHYAIPREDAYDGKPVFPSDPVDVKMETKMVYMGAVLETYEKLLKHMINHLPGSNPHGAGTMANTGSADALPNAPATRGNDKVRAGLDYLLEKIKLLKESSYTEEKALLDRVHRLKHIQMDSKTVQYKALKQLMWQYQNASKMVETKRSRQRRHTRRMKTRPNLKRGKAPQLH